WYEKILVVDAVGAPDHGVESATDDHQPDERAHHGRDEPRALPNHADQFTFQDGIEGPQFHDLNSFPPATQRKTSLRLGRRTLQLRTFAPNSDWSWTSSVISSWRQRNIATSPSARQGPSLGSSRATSRSISAPSISRMCLPRSSTRARGAPHSTSRPFRMND